MSVSTEIKLITVTSTAKEVLEPSKYSCCGNEEKSVMFVGPIRYVKPEELEKWLREVTPIPFVHIIKKYSNGYGHLHFDSHQESSAFYNLMKDVIKESPYGKIRFIAAQYFSTKLQVTYMNTFDNNEKKRKMIEIENNNENDEQSLDLPYNLYETRQEFIIIMDVPNVKSKNEISISVRKNHIIKIEGNICRNSIPGKQLHSKNPLPFGKFKIEVNLPENIDFEESVNVNVEAGVAILEIKKELVKSLKIS